MGRHYFVANGMIAPPQSLPDHLSVLKGVVGHHYYDGGGSPLVHPSTLKVGVNRYYSSEMELTVTFDLTF